MSSSDLRLAEYRGFAYLHLPIEAQDPLDFGPLEQTENRWNRAGQPTLYLAGDVGVALAELGRHADETDTTSIVRRLFRLEIAIEGLMDLRETAGGAAASTYVDRDAACSAADRARSMGCRGLLAPSLAFLDHPERVNVVVFLDAAGKSVDWVRSVLDVGRISIGG